MRSRDEQHTGLCSAPALDAETIDAYVLGHLGDFADAAERWLRELGHDQRGAEPAALAAVAEAEEQRDDVADRIPRLETRYSRIDDLDSPEADALLSMVGRERGELKRAQRNVQHAADELAAVRRTIAGDDLESARRSLVDALATGATASVVEFNRVLRDHFDAFVLRPDATVIPIWKLIVPTTVAETLLAQPEALLDDVLEPYQRAAEHALTLARDPEHNGESSQTSDRVLLRPAARAAAVAVLDAVWPGGAAACMPGCGGEAVDAGAGARGAGGDGDLVLVDAGSR